MAAAAERKRRTITYTSYGNTAYAPEYAPAEAQPRRQEVLTPRPKVRPRERAVARPQVQVRPAGAVAPFAIVGFLAVGVFAVLLMMSYIQLTALTDEAAGLASQLTALQQEEDRLSARFEQEFDMTSLQAAIGDTMAKPTNDQYVYIDLSEQDSVVLYGQEEKVSGPAGVLSGAQEVFRNIVDYFR